MLKSQVATLYKAIRSTVYFIEVVYKRKAVEEELIVVYHISSWDL